MSPSIDEVMTAVPKAEALVHAEIHAMRQVADAITLQGKQTAEHMAATTRALERMSEKVEGMSERLIRLEEAKHGKEIEKLTVSLDKVVSRLDLLESYRDQQKGAKALVDILRLNLPWLIGIAIGAMAMIGIEGAGK